MSGSRIDFDSIPTGGPAQPARLRGFSPLGRLKRRLLLDRVARRVVTLGGMVIIGSILSILIVIVAQVYPLFQKATVGAPAKVSVAAAGALRVGVDEYREVAYAVTADGISFFTLADGARLSVDHDLELGDATVVSVSQGVGERFALGLSDGRVQPVAVVYDVSFVDGERVIKPGLLAREPLVVHADGAPVGQVAYAETPDGPLIATAEGARRLGLTVITETTSMMGDTTRERAQLSVEVPGPGDITALAIDQRGDDLFIGTTAGEILGLDLRDKTAPKFRGSPARIVDIEAAGPAAQANLGESGVAVSALEFLIGDRTLVAGDSAGGISTWQMLREGGTTLHLVRVNVFQPHASRIVAISPSRRDKGFLTMDALGGIHLNYGTTGKTLIQMAAGEPMAAVMFAPKADGLLAVGGDGAIHSWGLKNRHPEITLNSLFGKVWYEGYEEPAYVWQSTGGTDDFEAKLSLTPLLYGTLKGTLYALMFAIPIGLLGALYASQFMHPNLRQRIKPIVEIMAAMPSVVLGFIAGLWLAPNMEKVVPGIFIMPFAIAACILAAVVIWRVMPEGIRRSVKPGYEIVLLVPVVLLGSWLALRIGAGVEQALLHGDYRVWMLKVLQIPFDQRNSMVVGFAMGFAVVPIIFTIAEDSLSSVPQHLRAASLALGATPWQTAIQVILPTASPGIFSAIMIGLGRAVGETMIVLMATGNTPMMNMSIFSGFRALSANIAVELPEAPDGGTLFRVLFLAALLLFALTFVMNTAAELVRLRLRKRYRYL